MAQAGVIAQAIYNVTFVSDLHKKITVGSTSFLFRQLKAEYLYNPIGGISHEGVFTATTERAAADMLYFNPNYHFDVPESIDFNKVKSIQKEIGYPG